MNKKTYSRRQSRKIKNRIFFKVFIKTSSILIGVFMAFYYFIPVFASPPSTPYAPGETTDPSCSPGDTNCTVYAPLTTTLVSSTAITMGTSSLNFAYDANNYTSFSVASDGALTVSSTNNATTSFINSVSVAGNISNVLNSNHLSSVYVVASTSVEGGPTQIWVSGRYAYTANSNSNTISVIDISNPNAPLEIATTSVGSAPRAISVFGKYAYLINQASNTLSIVDVSNPSAPFEISSTSLSSTGSDLFRVAVSGRYAYVLGRASGRLSVVDISNPVAPVRVATATAAGTPRGIFVRGRYLYTANDTGKTISIFDISNPFEPFLVSSTRAEGSPRGLYVSGRYAYLTNNTSNTMSVIDISNPVSSTQIASIAVGKSPNDIYVSGHYAYIPSSPSGTMSIIDVSNPAVPVLITNLNLEVGASGIYVSGRYAYVSNSILNTVSVIDISGIEVTSIMAHSAEVGNLQSRNDIFAQGNIMVGTSLFVGAGGIMSNGSISVFASSTGATSSIFDVSSVETPNIFKVFANGRIGINSSSPSASLTIQGTGSANPFIITSSSGASLLTVLTNGNIGIGTSTPIAILSVLASSTNGNNPIFELASSSGASFLRVGANGNVGINSSSPMKTFSVQGEVSIMGLATNITGNGVCITATGTITDAGAASCVPSALQFKTNVTPYTDSAVDLFKQLVDAGAIANYERKDKPGLRRGLIADYVAEIDKDLVVYNNDQIWSLNFEDFTGLAVKAVAELDDKFEVLDSRFNSATSTGWTFGSSTAGYASYEMPDFASMVLDNFTLAIKNSLRKLGLLIKDGIATVKEVFADKVTTQQLCLGSTCVNEEQLQDLLQKNSSEAATADAQIPSSDSSSDIVESSSVPTSTPDSSESSLDSVVSSTPPTEDISPLEPDTTSSTTPTPVFEETSSSTPPVVPDESTDSNTSTP